LLNLTVPQRLVQRDEAQTQVARTLIHREETFGKCRSRADRPSIACSSTGKDSGKLRSVGDRATTFVRCRHNTRGTLIEPRNTGRPGESVRFSASDTPRGTRDNTPQHRSSALPGRTVGARHLHRTGGRDAGDCGASDGERQQTIGPGLAGPAETHRANQKEGSEPPRCDAPSLHPEG